jgi:hypothetical protein
MCAAIFCNLARDIDVVEEVEVDEEDGADERARDALEGLCLFVIIAMLYYRYQVIEEQVRCCTRKSCKRDLQN